MLGFQSPGGFYKDDPARAFRSCEPYGSMVRRIFVFVVIGAFFFVGMQFLSVYFYAWEFDDFTRDELKFAPTREDDSKEHLVEHIKQEAQFYGLSLNGKDIIID